MLSGRKTSMWGQNKLTDKSDWLSALMVATMIFCQKVLTVRCIICFSIFSFFSMGWSLSFASNYVEIRRLLIPAHYQERRPNLFFPSFDYSFVLLYIYYNKKTIFSISFSNYMSQKVQELWNMKIIQCTNTQLHPQLSLDFTLWHYMTK